MSGTSRTHINGYCLKKRHAQISSLCSREITIYFLPEKTRDIKRSIESGLSQIKEAFFRGNLKGQLDMT